MNKSYICVVLSATLWGTLGLFAKKLEVLGFSTFQVTLLRASVALVALLLLLLLRDRSLLKIRLRDIWMFLGCGIASYFLFNIFYFTAVRHVGVTVSTVLLYTAPVFVTVLSALFFRERITVRKLLALALATLGCVFVSGILSTSLESISVSGIVCGILSGLTYALYSIFSVFALRRYKPLTITFYTFFFATLCAIFPARVGELPALLASPSTVLWAVGLGIVTSAAPYFLYTSALSGIEASRASILATIELVVAAIIGIAVFSEKPDAITVIGIVLVLSAALLVNIRTRKRD